MNRYKTIFIALLFVSGIFLVKTYACGCGGGGGALMNPPFSASMPVAVAPRPEFKYQWKAMDIVETFHQHKLKVSKTKSIHELTNRYPVFDSVNEALKFDLDLYGLDVGVYIHTFVFIDDLKKVQKHFLNLNDKGELYTWSFVKDNVVLVVSGTIPEDVARQYENALYSIRT